jgi:hypothetical protein
MSRIQFQIADRVWTVDEPKVVRIGRSDSSDIMLDVSGIRASMPSFGPRRPGGNCMTAPAATEHG